MLAPKKKKKRNAYNPAIITDWTINTGKINDICLFKTQHFGLFCGVRHVMLPKNQHFI